MEEGRDKRHYISTLKKGATFYILFNRFRRGVGFCGEKVMIPLSMR